MPLSLVRGIRTGAPRWRARRGWHTKRPATSSRWRRCWAGGGGRRAPTCPTSTRARCWPRCGGREPERLLDALLVAAFIEARSHERLMLLARGFTQRGDDELARFYQALGDAEERHAEVFLDLARPLVPADAFDERLAFFAVREAEILGALPHATRSSIEPSRARGLLSPGR